MRGARFRSGLGPCGPPTEGRWSPKRAACRLVGKTSSRSRRARFVGGRDSRGAANEARRANVDADLGDRPSRPLRGRRRRPPESRKLDQHASRRESISTPDQRDVASVVVTIRASVGGLCRHPLRPTCWLDLLAAAWRDCIALRVPEGDASSGRVPVAAIANGDLAADQMVRSCAEVTRANLSGVHVENVGAEGPSRVVT